MIRNAAWVLTPRLPWPLDDGGRIVLWQSLWAASRAYDTTLVSMVTPGDETRPLPIELVALGVSVVRVPHRPPAVPLAAVAGLVGPWPYTLARYQSARFRTALRTLLAVRRPSVVIVNHLHLAPYVDDLGGAPMILREHNVEHLWMHRYAESLGSTPAGLYARAQARRLRVAEARLATAAALVLAIQEEEAAALRAIAPAARVAMVPVGVDLTRYDEPAPVDPPVVLLNASFGWAPNAEGARRFLERGWPRVRERIPTARLRVVGKDLSRGLSAIARRAGAEPIGYVASMRGEFREAAVALVPLWMGGGARVKIVEAMAAGVPVVATPVAVSGLGLRPGLDFVEADQPESIGEAVAALLLAPERRADLAARGRLLASERWSLEATARMQNHLCAEVERERLQPDRSRPGSSARA